MGDFPEREGRLDYGGPELARFTRVVVTAEERDAYRRAQSECGNARADFAVPVYEDTIPFRPVPWRMVGADLCSYSSLSEAKTSVFEESGRKGGGGCCRRCALPFRWKKGREALRKAMRRRLFRLTTRRRGTRLRRVSHRTADRATDLGSAFHLIAQHAVEARREGAPLDLPSAGRVDAIARACGVTADQRLRLEAALHRWFASNTALHAASYARMRAEVPFCTEVEGEGQRSDGDGDEGHAVVFPRRRNRPSVRKRIGPSGVGCRLQNRRQS